MSLRVHIPSPFKNTKQYPRHRESTVNRLGSGTLQCTKKRNVANIVQSELGVRERPTSTRSSNPDRRARSERNKREVPRWFQTVSQASRGWMKHTTWPYDGRLRHQGFLTSHGSLKRVRIGSGRGWIDQSQNRDAGRLQRVLSRVHPKGEHATRSHLWLRISLPGSRKPRS